MLKARELDPFSTIIARQVALYYLLKRDYPRALIMLRQSNESGPRLTTTTEIGIYVQNKLYDEALAALDKESRERKDDPVLILNRGMVYAAQDRRGEALKMVRELEQLNGNDLTQAQWIAKIYAMLHDKEQALTWLERGVTMGSIGSFYRDEPVWDSVRDNPLFPNLLQRMGVPRS
jgi:tetratricopeptide (TPR) repeat protein